MNEKLKKYQGKQVLDYIKNNNINIKHDQNITPDYLNDIIDENFFVCETCALPMHNSNCSAKDERCCTYCNEPELWKTH